MKRIGTISYNIYCNFTNYGSALHTWALHQAIKKLGYQPVLVDYCPDVLAEMNPLNPYKNMWDKDEESRKMCEQTMPSILENYKKFDAFYCNFFERTSQKYMSSNFCDILEENIDGFICGSDTIFCIDEFKGFDDGFFANYPEMRNKAISYAASFGDAHFNESSYKTLNERLGNFKAIGIREKNMLSYIKEHVQIPSAYNIDPTLLLTSDYYDQLSRERLCDEPYILLYARRYNSEMERHAEKLAEKLGCRIVEISLRATNKNKGHIMRYDAGVEEFLSLVKFSRYVVTNSYHGFIFAVQYRRPVKIFMREQANNKIDELLTLMDMKHVVLNGTEKDWKKFDYGTVHERIAKERVNSFDFLQKSLELI